MTHSHELSPHATAVDQWNHVLQTYRASVDLYARVLKIRHHREIRASLGLASPAPANDLVSRDHPS
jgi:hypothetical protein